MKLSRYDRLRLCPQVELRSYVSEPELATFSGDMAQPSLGLVGPESRYQTLPGRGKAAFSMEAFWEPQCRQPLLPTPSPSTSHLLPAALSHDTGSRCQGALGCRERAWSPLLWPTPGFSFSFLLLFLEIIPNYYKAWHCVVLSTLYSLS